MVKMSLTLPQVVTPDLHYLPLQINHFSLFWIHDKRDEKFEVFL